MSKITRTFSLPEAVVAELDQYPNKSMEVREALNRAGNSPGLLAQALLRRFKHDQEVVMMDVTFAMNKESEESLTFLARCSKLSKSQVLHLALEAYMYPPN